MKLGQRVGVVTGGAQGIGAAIASGLATEGAQVAIWDLDAAGAVAAAGRITEEHGVPAIGIGVDVADQRGVEAAADAVERELGPVDILVNNAGIDIIGPFLESTEEGWGRVVAVNLMGTIGCCRRLVPGMVERGHGKVVNIGSDAGKVGSSGEAVYSATKGGVIAFTKTLAREVARHHVNVNCVCPGPTDTALFGQVAEANPKLHESLTRAIPFRRLGQPGDVAPVVVFLASDDAAFITGQALSVSGGLTMC